MLLTVMLMMGVIGSPATAPTPTPTPGAVFGDITASAEATAKVLRVQSQATTAPDLPLGAVLIQEPIDPHGDVAVCIDFHSGDGAFGPPLFEGETIVSIVSLRLSIVAAGHGVTINQAPGFAPIIDRVTRRKVEVYPLASDPDAAVFNGVGVLCGVEVVVMTSRGRRVPRTVLWRERNL